METMIFKNRREAGRQLAAATHLFEESGALEKVAELARDWFLKCFRSAT